MPTPIEHLHPFADLLPEALFDLPAQVENRAFVETEGVGQVDHRLIDGLGGHVRGVVPENPPEHAYGLARYFAGSGVRTITPG